MIIGPWAVVFNVMKVPEFHERCYTIVAIAPFSCAHPGFLLADSTLDEMVGTSRAISGSRLTLDLP